MFSGCRKRGLRRLAAPLVTLVATASLLGFAPSAGATLALVKPNPSAPATFSGHGGYSADGLGQNSGGGTVQAEVPTGSTVEQAYLYGTYYLNFGGSPPASDLDIAFDGTTVTLDYLANSEPGGAGLGTARADVTDQVKAKVGTPAAGGITDFVIGNDPTTLDGVALVVIYSNPGLPDVTIAVLDGGSKPEGDQVTFNFANPIDPTASGFSAIMSAGSGFSFQSFPEHACGSGQTSNVDINGSPLTRCLGNWDDGEASNGALITVGGVGDDTSNPANPSGPGGEDDELYNIQPLMNVGDNQLVIDTANPSTDDNLFLLVIQVTAEAAVTTEDCDNGVDDDGDGQADLADTDCQSPEGPIGSSSCSDGVDNDGDGQTDGADAGCQPQPEGPYGDATCSDNVDNDGDGQTDSADTNCQGGAVPAGPCDAPGVIHGTPGDDVIVGTDGPDVICAGDGDDRVAARAGNDTVYGEGGRDRLLGQADDDTVNGGDGDDLSVNGGAGKDLVRGQNGADSVLGDTGDDNVQGNDGGDELLGGADADLLNGGEGNDHANGGVGGDTVNGGIGDDELLGSDGDDLISGNAGSDTVIGNAGNDLVNGNVGNDKVQGREGNDRLHGQDGDDTISGQADNDRVVGGNGADRAFGNDGTDIVQVQDGAGVDLADCGPPLDDRFDADPGDTVVDCEIPL